MKKVRIMTLAAAAVLIALLFTACGGAEVSVKINDNGTETTVTGTDNMTVKQLLEKAEIKLGDKDEVTPKADAVWKEANAKEITINRYAKVTVVCENDKKTVELAGGTVEKAIEKAGFKLSDGYEADVDVKSRLKDGMTITLSKLTSVELTADGKTNSVSTKAKTVKDFLAEQKIELGKNDEVTPKLDTKLKSGLKIVVKRVEYKEEKKTETVKFETENTEDDTLDEGETKVIQEGADGKKEITYKIKYVDGKEESRKKTSEKTVKEAVNQIIANGTKQEEAPKQEDAPQQNQNNSVQQAAPAPAQQAEAATEKPAGKTVVSRQKIYDCDGSGHGYYLIKYSDGTEDHEDF